MFSTHPIHISSPDHTLAGNLVLPEAASDKSPAPGVAILGGPGPVPLQRYSKEGVKQWPVLWSEALGEAGLGALCYDQRGSGLSDGLYHVADWEDLLNDAQAAVEMLAIQREVGSVAAVAWGEGCPFALQLAAQGLVAAAVLMAPAYHTAEERYAQGIARLAATRGLSDRVVQLRVKQWKDEILAQASLVQQGDRYALTDLGDETVPTNRARFLQSVVFDPAPVAAQVRVPVLLLHGEQDTVIPPAESEAMARALSAERDRMTYPGATHFLYRHSGVMGDAVSWLKHVLTPKIEDPEAS